MIPAPSNKRQYNIGVDSLNIPNVLFLPIGEKQSSAVQHYRKYRNGVF